MHVPRVDEVLPRHVPTSGAARWARLVVNVRMPLRRGAWYRALSAGSEEVVVEVHHRAVLVPRALLELRDTPPNTWGLVPPDWGGPYLVCPSCAERVRVRHPVAHLRCHRCHGLYATEQIGFSAVRSDVPPPGTTRGAGAA